MCASCAVYTTYELCVLHVLLVWYVRHILGLQLNMLYVLYALCVICVLYVLYDFARETAGDVRPAEPELRGHAFWLLGCEEGADCCRPSGGRGARPAILVLFWFGTVG